jgi:hypothetical protein
MENVVGVASSWIWSKRCTGKGCYDDGNGVDRMKKGNRCEWTNYMPRDTQEHEHTERTETIVGQLECDGNYRRSAAWICSQPCSGKGWEWCRPHACQGIPKSMNMQNECQEPLTIVCVCVRSFKSTSVCPVAGSYLFLIRLLL